jgi:hypothetical protein
MKTPVKNIGSRYFCESFYEHPCSTSGKNYASTLLHGSFGQQLFIASELRIAAKVCLTLCPEKC